MKNRRITLFYQDMSEYLALEPLSRYLDEINFSYKWSKSIFSKADIGIYALHSNNFWDFQNHKFIGPNSKFSVIVLHDMYQDNGEFYKFFQAENWSIFDLALVPGDHWINIVNFAQLRDLPAFPKYGFYEVGWPKADKYPIKKFKIKKKLNILVAASWMNRKTLMDISANLKSDHYLHFKFFDYRGIRLNKSLPWFEVFKAQLIETDLAVSLAKKLKLDFSFDNNFNEIYKKTDLIISNGSNIMFEGILCNIPSISIYEWEQPYGSNGQFMKPQIVNFPGILCGSIHNIENLIEIATSKSMYDLIKIASSNLSNKVFRGKSAKVTIEKILMCIKKADKKEYLVNDYKGSKIFNSWTILDYQKNFTDKNLKDNLSDFDKIQKELLEIKSDFDKIQKELLEIKKSKLYKMVLKFRKILYFHRYLTKFLK